MNSFDVWDRGGYDMHGLPTENAVQKKLGLKTKEEIEKYGVEKFIKECMKFSVRHADYMSDDLQRLGIWMEHKHAYKPIEKDYISGEWTFFKKAWEQGRLYKGSKVMLTNKTLTRPIHSIDIQMSGDKVIKTLFERRPCQAIKYIVVIFTAHGMPPNIKRFFYSMCCLNRNIFGQIVVQRFDKGL